MFIEYNNNPLGKRTDDCVVRAISKALNLDWRAVYTMLSARGLKECDLFQKNYVWSELLKSIGFERHGIDDTCPDCYTIKDFALDNKRGIYIVGTGEHVVTVEDGNWYDTWNSGNSVPLVFFRRT